MTFPPSTDIVGRSNPTFYIVQTDADMAGSATSIRSHRLCNFGDDYFNAGWQMVVLFNGNPANPPSNERRDITDYVSATGTFTVNSFSANVVAGDFIMLVRKELNLEVTENDIKVGVCNIGMGASTTAVSCGELAEYGNDYFNMGANLVPKYYMKIIKNANSVGNAPEGEYRIITDYVSASGTFTVQPFSANVEASDVIAIISAELYNKLELQTIQDYEVGHLILNETGGSITTDGTEQNVYINNSPSGVFEPLTLELDLDNMVAGDSIIIREYYIHQSGGAFKLKHYTPYSGVDGGLPLGQVTTTIFLVPNRFGIKVTIQRTGGTDRAYPWAVFKNS